MKFIWFPITAVLFSHNIFAHGVEYLHAPQHQHGIGDISITWQEAKLTVTAVYSGQDTVKFEHLPRNAKEKRQVRDVYQKLIDQPVITAIGCQASKVSVASALFAEHSDSANDDEDPNNFISDLLGESTSIDHDNDTTTNILEHMDFAAVYTFNCQKNQVALNFQHFSSFPALQQIRVHQDDLKNKIIQTLNPKNSKIQATQK